MKFVLLFLILMVGGLSFGATTRTIQADTLASTSGTYSQTLPSGSGTVMLSAGLQQVRFSGINGTVTAFTLPSTPANAASVHVHIDGMLLIQSVDYTIVGTTVTFTTAPISGQNVIATYTIY